MYSETETAKRKVVMDSRLHFQKLWKDAEKDTYLRNIPQIEFQNKYTDDQALLIKLVFTDMTEMKLK